MKTVFPATVAASNICKKQNYRADTDYRLSAYCVQVDCEDGILLYNTLTGAMLLLENGEAIENQLVELVENRFMVPVGMDEIRFADQVRAIV